MKSIIFLQKYLHISRNFTTFAVDLRNNNYELQRIKEKTNESWMLLREAEKQS